MTKNDRIIGFVLLAIAIYMLYYANTVEYQQFEADPGPALFPLIVAIGLIVCSAGLIFWPKEKQSDDSIDQNEELPKKEFTAGYLKTIVVAVSSIVYVLLLENIGFIISTLIFLTFIIWYLAEQRNRKMIVSAALTSVIVTFSVYFIFEKYLQIYLP